MTRGPNSIIRKLAACSALAMAALRLAAQEEPSPFLTVPTVATNGTARILKVEFKVPPRHRLYADALAFQLDGKVASFALPQPKSILDKHSGETKRVFESDFLATASIEGAMPGTLSVSLHGCNEEECFFPETRRWNVSLNGIKAIAEAEIAALTTKLTDGFEVAARTSGFQSSGAFLSFLSQTGGVSAGGAFAGLGLAATIGLILLGGLALNLTPCVLPMIPINVAILGAGARNGNRARGFALGSAYGAGMACAYGALGLVVVLTGAKFGVLNSSPWFNFAIAVVFVVLGLAMLDRFAIDLSRFQRRSASGSKGRGAFIGAAGMGALSALLAGACVAPVVISVLLLAATRHQQGSIIGLLLPFVLGIGMALPWPFAAAGLSFLPKPGAWMTRVKHVFAVFIFGFAVWYGALGWRLLKPAAAMASAAPESSIAALRAALAEAQASGRPVLVDFWASWCKNCSAMEHSTLRDAGVQKALDRFTVVKFQAERLNDAALKPVLDEFGVIGLPTYVVLKPSRSKVAVSN